jgi:SNF2 family DNA or RNA helicase
MVSLFSLDSKPLDGIYKMELRPYQGRAGEFWIENKCAYLAIDMGLGKTAIVLHAGVKISQPILLVAPLEVAYNTWPDEIHKWSLDGEFDYEILHGAHKLALFKRECKRLRLDIINYEGIPWLYNELFKLFKAKKPLPYKVLVLDESTAIKDPNTNRFKYFEAMADMFNYRVALSGTPIGNSLKDLWAQYYILDKGQSLGKNYRDFECTYFEQNPFNKYDWKLRFRAEHAIHKLIAPRTFRLQSDDYVHLPERIYNTISLELPSPLRIQYESFKKDFVLLLETATVKSLNQASLNSKLRQFIQGAIYDNIDPETRVIHFLHDIKVAALVRYIEQLAGRSALCLTQFKFEIPLIRRCFPSAPAITGETPRSERQQIFKDWNAGKIPLLIAHPKTISKGLNLQKGGHNICWFAQTYSLLDYLQTNKRLHRSGQENVVTITHLALKGTIDELVANALTEKGMTQDKLLDYLKKETDKWLKKE